MIRWACPWPRSRTLDLDYSSSHSPGQWEGVPSSCVHSCWARVLASGGVILLAPAPHGSVAAVWAEIPFFGTSGIFQKERCQGTQENKRANLPKALLEHEMFSWWKVSPGAQAPAAFRASPRQPLLELPKAPVGTCPSQNPPLTFLSGSGSPSPYIEMGLWEDAGDRQRKLVGQWVVGLCHCKERGHFPIGMEGPGVFLKQG